MIAKRNISSVSLPFPSFLLPFRNGQTHFDTFILPIFFPYFSSFRLQLFSFVLQQKLFIIVSNSIFGSLFTGIKWEKSNIYCYWYVFHYSGEWWVKSDEPDGSCNAVKYRIWNKTTGKMNVEEIKLKTEDEKTIENSVHWNSFLLRNLMFCLEVNRISK